MEGENRGLNGTPLKKIAAKKSNTPAVAAVD
jgi:hypothetical protein